MSTEVSSRTALFRFTALSGLSFGLNLAITSIGHELFGLSPNHSFLVALIVVFFVNFAGMRYWVYGRQTGSLWTQLGAFIASTIGFRIAEYGLFWTLHDFVGWHYLPTTVTVLVVSFVTKFFFYRIAVFGRRPTD